MEIQRIKKKIRDQITVERVAIAVSAIVTYVYVMDRGGYRMVKPAYVTCDHVVFNRPFGGTTAIRLHP